MAPTSRRYDVTGPNSPSRPLFYKRVTMNNYNLTRQIPLNQDYDVIVIGGGPAGCTAATAAAREGASTLLIEATGCLGGMGTLGLVPAWCPFSDKEQIIYRGLAQQVFEACKAGMPHVKPGAMDWVPIDPELLKRIYDDMVLQAGAKILFNAQICAVDADDKGIVSTIVVASKAGLTAYRAKVYVDCTGDADLAAWAGADFHKGDDAGDLQPATHCFALTNVDEYAYLNGPRLHAGNPDSPVFKILASGRHPLIPDFHLCNNLVGPRTVGFNAGHLWQVDNTDPTSVSTALVQGRKMAAAFRDALAEFHPKAFAASWLVQTGALMGIRETRRIVGDYYLTFEDYMARRSFADEICRNSYFVDIHNAASDKGVAPADVEKFHQRSYRYEPGESHGVPYRCLTPKALRNVLVAGRSISCDRAVQGSVRVMPVCLAMGEAAGLAARYATEAPGCDVHAVDIQRLRQRLIDHGAYLPPVGEKEQRI